MVSRSSKTPAPVVRRATSQRSATNAAAVVKALTQEALETGLDNIAASSIAKRAGLTTGAIYSRYENSDEMLIALWQQVVAHELRALIMETVEAVTTRSTTSAPPDLIARLEKPSRVLGLGAEFVVLAQRNEVVGEVVIAEVSKWLREAGLQSSSTPIERAGTALGASIALGST
jgi:AcrR family transcriptional regulator